LQGNPQNKLFSVFYFYLIFFVVGLVVIVICYRQLNSTEESEDQGKSLARAQQSIVRLFESNIGLKNNNSNNNNK
jgi:hypothetical protein